MALAVFSAKLSVLTTMISGQIMTNSNQSTGLHCTHFENYIKLYFVFHILILLLSDLFILFYFTYCVSGPKSFSEQWEV